MRAILDGTVLAEADEIDLIRIEGNWYFPPASISDGKLIHSQTPYVCPWKGVSQYFSVLAGGTLHSDLAWSYPDPYASAVARVGSDFAGFVAFAPAVHVAP